MRSPFKLLDSYQYEDREVFFGREEETEELYQMIFKTPLLLVYGLSGTGKSSLVQCGLANRFDGTDWYPLFIRRQDNLNTVLQNTLNQALPAGVSPKEDLTECVTYLFRYYLRPIYLIFDQFEELFILGNPEEQEAFAQSIQQLILSELPCKIILLMREEFIGQLFLLEKVVPSIYDFRLRLESMGYKKVHEVIAKSCQFFQVGFENEDANIRQIYDNLSGGKSGVQLPYLQVYLDMLYREDLQRTFPALANANDLPQPLPALTFSSAEIEKLGNIQDVLAKFLQEQELTLAQELKTTFGLSNTMSIQTLLDVFVTEEGTKRPIAYLQEGEEIHLEEKIAQQAPEFSPAMSSLVVKRMIANRLIRAQDSTLELAHDALAALINNRRTTQQRQKNEALSRLNNYYKAFPITQEYLSRKQLTSVEDYLPLWKPTLSEGMWQFIEASYNYNENKENEQLLIERKKRKRAMLIAALGVMLALFTTLAFVYAVRSRNQLALATYDTQLKSATLLKVQGRYSEAISILRSTRSLYSGFSTTQKQKIDTLESRWVRILALQTEVDRNLAQKKWLVVLQNYQKMYRIDPDETLKRSITNSEKELEDAFNALFRSANTLLLSGRKAQAREALEEALSLKPGQSEVLKRLKEISE